MTIPNHRAQADELLADAEHMAASVPPHPSADGTAIFACARYLAAIHDTLLATSGSKPAPAAYDPEVAARNLDALKHELEAPMREHGECCDPAPADDLPGEPVEPGDLRAGDRVGFTWERTGERITCTLTIAKVIDQDIHVLRSDTPDSRGYHPYIACKGVGWYVYVSDVRLLERAPREGEEPDEALARVLCSAFWGGQVMPSADNADWKNVARAAREHIEAEQAENHPVGCGQMIRDVRDGDGFVTTIDGAMIAKTDSWNDLTERAEKAETDLADERDRHDATITERDALRERLLRLRADLSPGGLIWPVDAALRRDDERAAKEGQR